MGTLYDQPIRNRHAVTSGDLRHFAQLLAKLADETGLSHADLIAATAVLEAGRANNLAADNGDVYDEQIAGIGKEIGRIADELRELVAERRPTQSNAERCSNQSRSTPTLMAEQAEPPPNANRAAQRMEIRAAILEALRNNGGYMERRQLVKALSDRFVTSPIYRTLHDMTDAGQVIQVGDTVQLAQP